MTIKALPDSAVVTSDPATVAASKALPAVILGTNGMVYHFPKLQRVMPDGLLIEYRLNTGGTGMAKINFQELPKSLQQEFGYDPKEASAFENEQKNAMAEFSRSLQVDEAKRIAAEEKLTRVMARVTVVADNPTVNYTYFDTAQPRPMALLRASASQDGTRGAADRQFDCQSAVTLRRVQNESGKGTRFAVESLTIHLGLSVSIVLPRTPSPALQAHEEGHRGIAEHYYSCGIQAAQRIGELVAAKEVTIRSDDPQKAEEMAVTRVQSDVLLEYLKYTDIPAARANKYYDELTNEGRNNLDPNDAAQKATGRFEPTLPN